MIPNGISRLMFGALTADEGVFQRKGIMPTERRRVVLWKNGFMSRKAQQLKNQQSKNLMSRAALGESSKRTRAERRRAQLAREVEQELAAEREREEEAKSPSMAVDSPHRSPAKNRPAPQMEEEDQPTPKQKKSRPNEEKYPLEKQIESEKEAPPDEEKYAHPRAEEREMERLMIESERKEKQAAEDVVPMDEDVQDIKMPDSEFYGARVGNECGSLDMALSMSVDRLEMLWVKAGGEKSTQEKGAVRKQWYVSRLRNIDSESLSAEEKALRKKFCDLVDREKKHRFRSWFRNFPNPYKHENGTPKSAATFKNEIDDILKNNDTSLSRDAANRLAIVDGCTKTTGPIQLTHYQEFVRQYLTPTNPLKGLLLWHSVGSGKTCTMIAAASTSFETRKKPWHIILSTPSAIDESFLDNIFNSVCHWGMRQQTMEEGKRFDESEVPREKRAEFFIKRVAPCTWITQDKAQMGVQSMPSRLSAWTHQRLYNYISDQSHSSTDVRKVMQCIRKQNKKTNDHLHRCLVIIDEAHTFLETVFRRDGKFDEKKFSNMIKHIQNSHTRSGKNSVKFLLASATPQNPHPVNLFQLIKMLNPASSLPIEDKPYDEWVKGLNALTDQTKDAVFAKSEAPLNALERRIYDFCMSTRGLISYVDATKDVSRFPHLTRMNHIMVRLTEMQTQGIQSCLRRLSGDAKFRMGDDGRNYNARLLKCIQSKTNFGLDDNNREEYEFDSPTFSASKLQSELPVISEKIERLLERIDYWDHYDHINNRERHKQKACKHVIYTSSPTDARLVLSSLIANDFGHVIRPNQRGELEGIQASELPKDSQAYLVALLSATAPLWGIQQSAKFRTQLMQSFNDEKNRFGSMIRFLVIDDSMSEGINLFDVRHLYILEPTQTDAMWKEIKPDVFPKNTTFDDSRADQVIGRVTRMCGSKNLKWDDRALPNTNGLVPYGRELSVDRFYDVIDPTDRRRFKGAKTVMEILLQNKAIDVDFLKTLATQTFVKDLCIITSTDRIINTARNLVVAKPRMVVARPLAANDVKEIGAKTVASEKARGLFDAPPPKPKRPVNEYADEDDDEEEDEDEDEEDPKKGQRRFGWQNNPRNPFRRKRFGGINLANFTR